MFSSSERRLIRYTQSQLKDMGITDPTKYNARTAEQNAKAQQNVVAEKINSAQLPYFGNNVPTNVEPQYNKDGTLIPWAPTQLGTKQGAAPDGYTAPIQDTGSLDEKRAQDAKNSQQPGTSPEETGKIDQAAIKRLMDNGMTYDQAVQRVKDLRPQVRATASNTGLGGSFDSAGNFVPVPTSQPQGSAERIAVRNIQKEINDLSTPLGPGDVKAEFDSKGRMIKSAQQVAAELNAARTERAAALQKQLTEMQARQMNKAKMDASMSATDGLPPGSAPSTQVDPNAPPAIPTTPDMAGEDLAVKDAKAQMDERLKNIDAALPGALDEEDAKAKAMEAYQKQLDAADAQEKLDRDRAFEKERNDLAILDRSHALQQIENTKAELDQIRLNTENEIKNRRRINKLSGGHDFGGLDWVQKQTQAGLDTLNYLRDKAANMDGVWADKTIAVINNYGLDLRAAEATKKSVYAEDYATYTTKLDDIRKELKLDNVKKMEMRDAAHKDYADTLTNRDFAYGDHLNQLRLKSIDQQTTIWKTKQQTQQNEISNAIRMLAMSTKKGITFDAAAMASFEKTVAPSLPVGWFRKVITGGGGAYTNEEAMAAISAWVAVDPGRRDITQLGKSDVAMLVQVMRVQSPTPAVSPVQRFQSVGKGAAFVVDEGKPAQIPGTPAAFGATPSESISNDRKVYDELIASDPSLKGKFSYGDYLQSRQNYDLNTRIRAAKAATSIVPSGEEDTTLDDFINSDNPSIE